MIEDDELLSRLSELPPLAPDAELRRAVHSRARGRFLRPASSSRTASWAVVAAVVVYLGWAVRFASELYQ